MPLFIPVPENLRKSWSLSPVPEQRHLLVTAGQSE